MRVEFNVPDKHGERNGTRDPARRAPAILCFSLTLSLLGGFSQDPQPLSRFLLYSDSFLFQENVPGPSLSGLGFIGAACSPIPLASSRGPGEGFQLGAHSKSPINGPVSCQ